MSPSDSPSSGLVASLRARTAAQHAQLDSALNFRPGEVTRERYLGLLRGTLSVALAIEPTLTSCFGNSVGPAEHEQTCAMACATFASYAQALQQQGAIAP